MANSIILNSIQRLKYLVCFSIKIFNKYIFGYCFFDNRLGIFITPGSFIHIISIAKYNIIFKFDSLLDISVVDYPNKLLRFELNYTFLNYKSGYRITVKLHNDGFKPLCSIQHIFPSSNWLEREAWDMFGIKFLFHPNLRRILTDYGFKGHPLRKDFPLTGYIEIFYNDSTQVISAAPVELSQNMRFYHFDDTWSKYY